MRAFKIDKRTLENLKGGVWMISLKGLLGYTHLVEGKAMVAMIQMVAGWALSTQEYQQTDTCVLFHLNSKYRKKC